MNFIYLTLGKVLKPLFNLIIFSVLSFKIGQDQLGEYVYLITIFLIFAPLISFGTENYVITKFHRDKDFNINDVILLTSILSILSIILLTFIFNIKLIYLIGFILFAAVYTFIPYDYLERSKGYIINFSKVSIVVFCISFIIKVILIFYSSNIVIALILIFFLDFSTPFVLFLKKYRSFSIRKNISKNFKKIISVANFSTPFFLSTFSIVLINKIDHLMIPKLLDYNSLAMYSSAYRVYEGFFVFQIIFISVFFPYLSKFSIKKSMKIIGLYGVVFSAGISLIISLFFFFGESIFLTIYDIQYSKAYKLLCFLLFGFWASYFGSVITKIASLKKGGGLDLIKTNLIALIINIILNIILIPIFGLEGAVIATVFSQFVGSIFIWFFIRKFRLELISIFKSYFHYLLLIIVSPKVYISSLFKESQKMININDEK